MKTKTTPEQIAAILEALQAMRVRPFQCESCDPKYNAQKNCSGRTYYFTDDTLRFHKSRVLSSNHDFGGLLFKAICSDALDSENRKRGFRYVVHDVFGTCLSRPKLEEAVSSHKTAANQLDALEIDLVTHYREAIERERRYAADKVADCDKALALILYPQAKAD